MNTTHCTIVDLERLLAGQIEKKKAAKLHQHMEDCEICRDTYQECLENGKALEEIRQALKTSVADSAQSEAEDPPDDEECIDDYRLIRQIHRGGQGVVYEAFQKSTHRRVALKVLLGGFYAGKNAKRRFEREIELAASLHHPNIVAIHDSGITREHYYLVMDFIEGQPVDTYLATHALPFEQKIRLFMKICEAINYAHQRGVIHRDLKPSNILIDPSGEPFILDFGLARKINEMDLSLNISREGQILGTPQFMAPEQSAGLLAEVDARTDIYALGLILYGMLTGKHPYPVSKNLPEMIETIQKSPPAKPSIYLRSLDRDIEVIVLKALEKESSRRYQSVAELQGDLNLWQQGLPIVARSVSSIYVLRKMIVRHRMTSSIIGLLFLMIVGFSLICLNLYQTAEAARIQEEHSRKNTQEAFLNFETFNRNFSFFNFICLWEAGFSGEMCFYSKFFEGTKEKAAVEFLMSHDPLAKKETLFRSKLGLSQAAFADFVVGEWHRKQGNTSQALESYHKSLAWAAKGSLSYWQQNWIKARIQELTPRLDIINTPERQMLNE